MTGYLTPFYLALSVLVFSGLGITAFLGGWKIVPWLRDKTQMGDLTFDLGTPRDVDEFFRDSKAARFFFKRLLGLKRIRRIIKRPRAFLLYLIPYSVVWMAMFLTLFELLTSVGLRSPLTWQGLAYDLVFARSNGQPNGSLITDYVGVVLLMWAVAIKYRDGLFPNVFLGVSVGLFLVGVHEGIWVFFYYLQYGQYLHLGTLAPNIVSDAFSVAMYAGFIAGFLKLAKAGRGSPRPFAVPDPRSFTVPILATVAFMLAWFFLPPLFSSFYTHFPITTVNNPEFGQTIFNETKYWPDFWTNLVEGLGWKVPTVLFAWAALRRKAA